MCRMHGCGLPPSIKCNHHHPLISATASAAALPCHTISIPACPLTSMTASAAASTLAPPASAATRRCTSSATSLSSGRRRWAAADCSQETHALGSQWIWLNASFSSTPACASSPYAVVCTLFQAAASHHPSNRPAPPPPCRPLQPCGPAALPPPCAPAPEPPPSAPCAQCPRGPAVAVSRVVRVMMAGQTAGWRHARRCQALLQCSARLNRRSCRLIACSQSPTHRLTHLQVLGNVRQALLHSTVGLSE